MSAKFAVSKSNLTRFHSACAGVMEVVAIDYEHALTLFASALVTAVNHWSAQVCESKQKQLCLDCDRRFSQRHMPRLFMVALPFANLRAAMVTGVCHLCAERKDLADVFLRRVRSSWPDAQILPFSLSNPAFEQ
jgi:hypothetical protein